MNRFLANQMLSCYLKAASMFDGQGVEENQQLAISIKKNLCDTQRDEYFNHTRGYVCDGLAGDYASLGNLSLAKQYYIKACDLGYEKACTHYEILDKFEELQEKSR